MKQRYRSRKIHLEKHAAEIITSYLAWRMFPITSFPFVTLSWRFSVLSHMKVTPVCGPTNKHTYIFVNEKPAIQFATKWDFTLHFIKLNSRQIQIIKQTPNILLAKISAYTVFLHPFCFQCFSDSLLKIC